MCCMFASAAKSDLGITNICLRYQRLAGPVSQYVVPRVHRCLSFPRWSKQIVQSRWQVCKTVFKHSQKPADFTMVWKSAPGASKMAPSRTQELETVLQLYRRFSNRFRKCCRTSHLPVTTDAGFPMWFVRIHRIFALKENMRRDPWASYFQNGQ